MKNHEAFRKSMNRRQFLRSSSGTVASLALGPALFAHSAQAALVRRFLRARAAAADEPAPGFFILLTTNGGAGLDVTLGLDPQVHGAELDEKDVFLEYRPDGILAGESLRFAPAAAPLMVHAESIAVVNGIVMRRDSGHSQLLEYMQSGDPMGSAGSLSTEYTANFADTAFGTIYNSFALKLPPWESAITSYDSLKNKLGDARYDPDGALPIDPTTDSELSKVFDALKLATMKIPAMKTQLETLPHSTTEDEINRTIAAAFLTGASSAAQIQIQTAGTLDTHSGHEKNHLIAQTEFWTKVSDLFALFKKIPFGDATLFDATTFYVTSEFSRTPALTPAGGKDHNPFTNSALLAGRGISGGKAAGASHVVSRKKTQDGAPLHIGLPYDYAKGEVVQAAGIAGASMIYPENVVATLRKCLDLPGNGAKALSGILTQRKAVHL